MISTAWGSKSTVFGSYIKDNVYTLVANCLCTHECYFGVYFPSCGATKEINTKITLERVREQFVVSVNTVFYFLPDIIYPYITIIKRSSRIDIVLRWLIS